MTFILFPMSFIGNDGLVSLKNFTMLLIVKEKIPIVRSKAIPNIICLVIFCYLIYSLKYEKSGDINFVNLRTTLCDTLWFNFFTTKELKGIHKGFTKDYFFISFTASTSFGRTFIASPTIPYWAT